MIKVLTTSEVARHCGVSQRTVIRWIDRGELNAYKLPGRGDHRVLTTELARFIGVYRMPVASAPQEVPKRVLIADDEPAMARAIQRVVRKAGFETAIASNGFEAGSLLYTFQPGLITLDLRMPGLDGIDVLRFLQKAYLPSPFKILVVSADTNDRLAEALKLGAHGVVQKPFSNEELLRAVMRIFEESKIYAQPPLDSVHAER